MRLKPFLVPALLAVAGVVLAGCTTVRTQSYPGKSMDEVFKGSIRGLCAENKKFIVYDADRQAGDIKILTRGFWTGHRKLNVKLTDPTGNAPTVTVMFPGVSPIPDRIIQAVNQGMTAQQGNGEESKPE